MIPKRIQLSGFLSYLEEVEIDFSQLHLACIAGSNGAGKSTLLDAITWAIFGQARKRDDSLIHNASDAARVVFEFEYESNNYCVQRSKKRDQPTMLEFHLLDPTGNWRPLTERTMRDTEAAIQNTLHLDYDTFVSAAFFLQGKADQFTQQRPAERKRILGSILGLDSWDGYRQAASESRRSEETELAVLDARLNTIRSDLDTEQNRQAAVQRLQILLQETAQQSEQQETVVVGLQRTEQHAQTVQERKDALGRQLEENHLEATEVQTRLSERRKELGGYRSVLERKDEIEAAYHAWETHRAETDRLSEMAARAHELELKQHTLRSEERESRLHLEQDLASHEKRLDERQALISQEEGLLQAKAAKQDAVKAGQEAVDRKPALEAEHHEALRLRGELLSEIPRLRQEMDELKERIDQLQAVDDANCPLCEQDLTPQARQDLTDRLTGQGCQLGDRYRENKNLLKEAEERIHTLEGESRQAASAEARLERLALEVEQISSRLADIQEARDEIRESIEPGIARAREALSSRSYAGDFKELLAALEEESGALGYDPGLHEAFREALKDLQAAPAEMRKLEQADAAVRSLGREIDDLERQRKSLSQQVARLEQEVADASAEENRLEQELSHLADGEQLLAELRGRENETRKELGAAERSLADLDAMRQTLQGLEAEREERSMRVQCLRRLEVAFGYNGVPALLIEQSLPDIEARANEILELLTDGAMSIRLATQQAYKDQARQDMRETLDILISDGQGMRDYLLFSGGERFRVDFAIRLALSKVLAQRAGARLQMLVIDEGFGGQDEIGRQKLVEAVNRVQGDFACILVITHIDALKDVFPTRIEVTKTPQGSVAQVV